MTQLTQQDFLDYSGYDVADVNTDYLQFLLDSVEFQITNYLDEKFVLETINWENAKRILGNGSDFVKIGCWQSINVAKGALGSEISTNLIENTDFVTESVLNNETIPTIYGIRLVKESLDRYEFVKIYGLKGFSSGFPNDLKNLIFNLVKEKIETNKINTENEGRGLVTSEKDLTSSVVYTNSGTTAENKRQNTFDLVANPELSRILGWYKQFTRSNSSLII